MNCSCLNKDGFCTACFNDSCLYSPNEEEKKKYCCNEMEMISCQRLLVVQTILEARNNKGSHLSNVNLNTNTLTNTSTASVNLSLDVKEAFEIAYATVEAKKDISQNEKDMINGRLLVLERELGKDPTKIDKSKVARLREGFEKYGWLIPVIIDIIQKALRT